MDKLYISHINSPIGDMVAISDDDSIYLLEFADNQNIPSKLEPIIDGRDLIEEKREVIALLEDEIVSYFKGEIQEFKTPLHIIGTDFQKKAWQALREIPYGSTISYKEQAEKIADPKACRAVANANGSNRIAILVPCHRVIASSGDLSGYDGGVERKKYLLELEDRRL